MDSGAGDKMALRQLAGTPVRAADLEGWRRDREQGACIRCGSLRSFARRMSAARTPFDDQVALQLGDRSDDDDNRPAQRAAGVDLLTEADEARC